MIKLILHASAKDFYLANENFPVLIIGLGISNLILTW